jgi:ribulose-5-phosphate 4-epimerase/fuculose-1-phosphate aldolase
VAKYGARGSDQAIVNIVEALKSWPSQQAVLLENHGILCFGPDVAAAQRVVFALEETAQLAILASAIGTPRALTAEMGAQTQQRAREFAARGTVTGG